MRCAVRQIGAKLPEAGARGGGKGASAPFFLQLSCPPDPRKDRGIMAVSRFRLLKHEAVPKCGSFEVRFPDGRPSRFFYWDDVAGRRLNPGQVDGKTALELAKALARAERDK
jgi:hypothetical protein